MKNTLRRTLVLGLSALFVASCDDDSSGPQLVGSVAVSPLAATLIVGNKQQLSVNVTDTEGDVMAGLPVTWTSANPAIATVNATGEVTAVLPGGPILITALVNGKTGHTSLTVTLGSITISPNPAQVTVGRTTQLTIVGRDAAGNPVPGRTFAVTSSAPAIATVNSAGLVTGVSPGTATITATGDGRTATTTVTVVAATP